MESKDHLHYTTLPNRGQLLLLKSFTAPSSLDEKELKEGQDILQKSAAGPGLTSKKVLVQKKDGSSYYATRYISQEDGKSQRIMHPKYRHEDDMYGDTEEQKISNIVDDDNLKPLDKVRALVSLGVYDKGELTNLSGHKYPADIPGILRKEAGIDVNDLDNPNAILPTSEPGAGALPLSKPEIQTMAISEIEEKQGSAAAFKMQEGLREALMLKYGVTVNDKWNSYESRLNRLIRDGFPKAVMAYGTGGVGKTYTFDKLAEHNQLIEYDPELDMAKGGEEYDYIRLGGKVGSREMQRAMYEHSNKLIVFDDCDSMWDDPGLINVLKNALDSSGDGKVQWAQRLPETSKGAGDGVPSRFRFEGRMLFITNLSKKQLTAAGAAPIAESRASSIDLTMNMDQTLERLEDILPYIRIRDYKGVTIASTEEDKRAALDTLKEVKGLARVDQFNTRTLGKLIGEAREYRLAGKDYDYNKLAIFALQEFGLI